MSEEIKQRIYACFVGSLANGALFFQSESEKFRLFRQVQAQTPPKPLWKRASSLAAHALESLSLAAQVSVHPIASLVSPRYALRFYGLLSERIAEAEKSKAPPPLPPLAATRAEQLGSLSFDREKLVNIANGLSTQNSWKILKLKEEILASLATPAEPEPFLTYTSFFLALEKLLSEEQMEHLEDLIENRYETETEDQREAIETLLLMQQALRAREAPHTNFKELKAASGGEELERLRLASKIQKCKIAFRFSLGIKTASHGISGTQLIYDPKKREKLLGVFKPDVKYGGFFFQLNKMTAPHLGLQGRFLPSGYLAAAQAEVIAYRLDRFFGFDVVPASEIVSIEGKEGSFQMAASSFKKADFKEAKETGEALDKEEFSEEELELFQRFALHDFLIGNLDAHEENWFVSLQEGRIRQLVAIDKGNSFLKSNPKGIGYHQYEWRGRAIAKKPFTQKMHSLMREVTSERIEQFLQAIRQEEKLKGLFDEKSEKHLMQRARAIEEMSKSEQSTPYALSLLVRDEDFLRLEEKRKRERLREFLSIAPRLSELGGDL